MDKDKLKNIINKAKNLEQGKDIALAKEFISINDKVDTVAEKADLIAKEVDTKLTEISDSLKKKLDEELSYEIDYEKIKGDKGEKGDTGKQGIQGIQGKQGEKGDKGENGNDGKDGIDGLNGLDGKDGSPDTGEQIVSKINELSIEEDKQIDFKHIKGWEKFLSKSKDIIVGGIRFLSQLVDVKTTNLQNGDVLKWNSTTNQWENGVDSGGVDNFLDLTDTPDSYSGQIGKVPVVNSGEDALEFTSLPTGDMEASVYDPDGGARQVAFKDQLSPGGLISNNVYFTTIDSDITGYKKLSYLPEATETELSASISNGEYLARTYLYDDPIDTTYITAGTWYANFTAKVDKTPGVTQIKFEVFLRHADTTETTLFSVYSSELNNTDYQTFSEATTQLGFSCVATDRFGIRIYFKTTSTPTVVINTIVGDGRGAYFNLPILPRHSQLRAMQGGTTDEYYHLTAAEHTASTQLATNIQNGLLSSSDWTTFNSKAPTNNPIFTGSITTPIIKPASDSTTAIQITKANGTTNVLDIDTTNVRVGIGTTAPLRKLHVNGDAFLIERNANDPAIIWRNTLDSTYPTQEWILGARVTVSGHLNSLLYTYRDDTNGTSTVIMALTKDGKIGLGTLTPTARLQLPAGTATANTAPLKLTSGVLNTVSEAGTMEFNTDDLYFTTTTGAGVGATYAKYPPVQSSTYVTSTTRYSTSYYAYFTTNPARSLTGSYAGNQWISSTGSTTNQRFHIDLGSAQTITRIYYENSHNSGTVTNTGVKNFTLWGSNTASDFSDLVYANDGTWVQLPTEVTQFEEHVASDTTDPKYIEVTNTTAYRYYAFKFADNWGATTFMGARRIELWNTSTLDGRRNIITSNDGKLTAGRIPYATTNGRLKDSKKLTFDGLTLTVPSVRVAYVAKTADYTLTASDYTVECTANTFTISLPTAVGITGRIYNIKNTGTGTITVDANDSETIDGELTQTVAQWENLQIQSNGTNWIIL